MRDPRNLGPARILFVAPLPPPLHGQSVVSQHLLEHWRQCHQVSVIDTRKQSLTDGLDSVGRIREVLSILARVYRQRRCADALYLTSAESLAGNMKDMVICVLCWRILPNSFVHVHGGSLRRLLYDRNRFAFWFNRVILRRIRGAIVLGPSHQDMFDGILERSRVHIVANYADSGFFFPREDIAEKFQVRGPIRVLYMAHMTDGKGYRRLLDAYRLCDESTRQAIEIDFAGGFEATRDTERFCAEIEAEPHLRYHGVVTGSRKRALLQRAHVLCLPTSFYEGQPISILEAYASGTVVVTAVPPGVADVFSDGVNGFAIRPNTAESLSLRLGELISRRRELAEIAWRNRETAEGRYTVAAFEARIDRVTGWGREQPV